MLDRPAVDRDQLRFFVVVFFVVVVFAGFAFDVDFFVEVVAFFDVDFFTGFFASGDFAFVESAGSRDELARSRDATVVVPFRFDFDDAYRVPLAFDFAGVPLTRSCCPGNTMSRLRRFSRLRFATVVPFRFAIRPSDSPRFTT